MKTFLCIFLLAGIQAYASTVKDVDRLVELLSRQLKRDNTVGDPENIEPVLPVPEEVYPENYPEYMPVYNGLEGSLGCSYIEDFFEEIFNIPTGTPMKDKIVYDPAYMNKFTEAIEMFRGVDDPVGASLLTMRRFIRELLMDRLRCPATMFERFMFAYMRREDGMMGADPIHTRLVPVLTRIPHIETSSITPDKLAALVSRETHRRVFMDTMNYVLPWALSDVTYFAKHVFNWLRKEYNEIINMTPQTLSTRLEEFLRNDITMVYCPSMDEVVYRHIGAIWDLRHGLMDVETHQVCPEVRNFIEQFVPEPSAMHGRDETEYGAVLNETCDIIHDYIKELAGRLEKLEAAIETGKTPEMFKELIRPLFEEKEMHLLDEVLETVGWPLVNVPEMPNLSIEEVIANELTDVEHWNEFINNLTPDTFNGLTMDTLVRVIKKWLKEKETRINLYREYKEIEPVNEYY